MVVLSMNGTMLQPRMLQPTMMQPGRMQPAAGGCGGFRNRTAARRAFGRGGSPHRYRHLSAITPLRAPGQEDFISAATSRTLVPMRI
jgi:hypothetical protein